MFVDGTVGISYRLFLLTLSAHFVESELKPLLTGCSFFVLLGGGKRWETPDLRILGGVNSRNLLTL